jgi:lipid II:glycine glycyltransferase (peptidoglycan interpeptide bridge formation enzyme)
MNFRWRANEIGTNIKMTNHMNFLQSPEWRKFQEAVGRKTYTSPQPSPYKGGGDFSIIEHQLPIVGKYFYVPKWPMAWNMEHGTWNTIKDEILKLAKVNNAKWIRIEPENEKILKAIKNNIKYKIAKAPHDMQPRQIFVVDITKAEEELLVGMKAKTRYNIRLAERKEVRIKKQEARNEYIHEFLRLTKIMAKRQGITAHPDGYYRKMFETIPGEILKLYVAEYQGRIIAANIMVFYGDVCTYLHGASDDKYRNLMAPYLLQWQGIKDAKEVGCKRYDMGGVKTKMTNDKCQISNQCQNPNEKILDTKYQILDTNWAGITRFKLGFSPETAPIEFPGSYDIVINPWKYGAYLALGKIKSWIKIF